MEVYLVNVVFELKQGGSVTRTIIFSKEEEAKKFMNNVYTNDVEHGYRHIDGSIDCGSCCVEDIHLNRIYYTLHKKHVFEDQEGVMI